MTAIADSSGLISLFVKSDSNYSSALKVKQSLEKKSGKIYVSSEVFSETINIFGKKFGHEKATKAARVILSLKSFIFVDSDDDIRLAALKYFEKSPTSVSYTDCMVMAFADHFETKIILGFDEAFIKNGYKLPE